MFDDLLMLHRSSGVQDNHNQVACPGNSNNLPTSTFTVLGTFDNTWQIQELYFGAFVLENSGDAGQGSELIRCDFGKGAYVKLKVPVSFVSRVDLPTDGKPIMPTLASPDLETSKPSPTAPFLPPLGSINYRFSLASLALSRPR